MAGKKSAAAKSTPTKSKRTPQTEVESPVRRASRRAPAKKSARPPHSPSAAHKRGTQQQAENESFPVVGIGASAGGLEAFRELLKHLPNDSDMAFVLVPHLDPTHESMLTDLLARETRMPVDDVTDGEKVEPNRIFVIPRNASMIIRAGVLHLSPRGEGRGHQHSIDKFLRSLAEDQNNRAIGIILSGTASDGTLGLEAIKGAGGITFAQDTESAKYDSMPRSAIASGCVDFVLTPERIAKELARISRHPYVVSTEPPAPPEVEARLATMDGFSLILNMLRKAHGVDFSLYRSNTLHRRMMRRMLLNKVDGYDEYARYLSKHPEEVENLYQDILINVTTFFRHPETFEVLKKKIFPQVIEHRAPDETLRIWVLGCSTGEEAYSIAISFVEFAGRQVAHIPLQIFATDVNDRGIEKARAGIYAKNITEDVSPDRLRRFFIEEDGGYRVSKPIRDMCVFAQQNALTDPPFSRMDLVSCRNLLIYLEPAAQRKVIPLLHYALKPGGFLWLGSSETIGAAHELFEVEDKKKRFYSKKPTRTRHGFDFPVAEPVRGKSKFSQSAQAATQRAGGEADALKEADRIILSRFAPGSVLINEELEILQFRGRTAPYLEPPPGKATLNLLKMTREGLMVGLRSALLKARKEHQVVRKEDLRVKHDGQQIDVDLEVIPIKRTASPERYFLVLFEPRKTSAATETRESGVEESRAKRSHETSGVKQLKQELDATRDYLQSVVEQYEAGNEELQSANEEIQSSNEELQSINEELETAKEELEASNEELTTVNEELQNRNAELARANSDLQNLLNAAMPIVMLDDDLRIRRFTSSAEKVLKLIPSDVGRPIGDLKISINLPDLEQLITEAIETVSVREREAKDAQGRWHLIQIRPYKTLENKIDGAVIVLVDIDAIKQHESQIQAARDYAESIVETVEPLLILDEDLRVRSANASFYKTFKVTREDTENRFVYELGNRQWDIPELRTLLENVLAKPSEFHDFKVVLTFPHIGDKTMLLNAREIRQLAGPRRLILLAIEDITAQAEMKQERDQLLIRERAARAQAEEANRIKDEFLAICSHELRTPLSAIQGWAEMLARGGLDEDTSHRALETISRNVRAQTQIIKDLLDVSRVITGKLRLEARPVELIPIVETAMDVVRPAAEAKGVALDSDFDAEVGVVFGDSARLQQIVWNLLSNAVKFTPRGGRVDVRVRRENTHLAISVEDTGVGIDSGFLPHVFELFRQADSKTTRTYGGLGLGLAIVRNLVESHGGTVRVESAGEGQGSTFTILLPERSEIVEVSDEAETTAIASADAGEPEAPEIAPSLEGLRILIVDDDRDSRQMLNAALSVYGGEVKACSSSAEALEMLSHWLPDVIVSDIGMPREDGYDLIQSLRGLSPERGGSIPALALTGYASANDRKRALASGYQMHISKPVELSKLAAAVARLADQSVETKPPDQPRTPKAAM